MSGRRKLPRWCVAAGLALLSAAPPALAQQATAQREWVLAVPNIKATDVSKSVAAICRNAVEAALIKTGKYRVLSYTDIEEVLSAQEFSLSDCTDESCAVKIGKLLAAERIVVGDLSAMDKTMVLTLRLVDVATGKSLNAELMQIGGLDQLTERTFAAVYRLVGLEYSGDAALAGSETGSLYVTVPAGSSELQVTVDGVERGSTPLLLDNLPVGTHVVRAGPEGQVFEQQVTIKAKQVTELVADRSLLRGSLLVQIEPADASGYSLTVNGVAARAGLVRDLPAGDIPIAASGGGWRYEGTAKVEQDKVIRLTIRLEAVGEVFVRAPQGSTIEVVGGQTRLTGTSTLVEVVAVGRYELKVTHPDYNAFTSEIEVKRGQSTEVAPEMTRSATYDRQAKLAALRQRQTRIGRQDKAMTVIAVVLAGLGAVAGGATGYFEFTIGKTKDSMYSAYDQYLAATDTDTATALWQSVTGYQTQLEQSRLYRNVAAASAAGTAIASGVLLLLRPSPKGVQREIQALEAAGR